MYFSHSITNPTNGLCTQRWLRSAWTSTQSDQFLLSAWRKLGSLAIHWVHSENIDRSSLGSQALYVMRQLILYLIKICTADRGALWLDFDLVL